MATMNVKAKAIRVYQSADSVRYRMDIETMVDAIAVRDGEYIETQVSYLDFAPSVLIAQVINCVPGVDVLYTKKKESAIRNGNQNGFGAAELQVVLRDATITVDRTKFEAGTEYEMSDGTTGIHEHAGYSTSITEIKVSDKVQEKLNEIADKLLSL